MYSFPSFKPFRFSLSSSNYCFLTHTQVSRETGKVVWYYHLFKNFPVCCDPHGQRLPQSHEAEVDVSLKILCSHPHPLWSLYQLLLANLSGSPLTARNTVMSLLLYIEF